MELRNRLVEAIYEKKPGSRAKALTESGLDSEDSGEIIARLNTELASCLLEAMREYSMESDLNFEEQITLLESKLDEGVAGQYFASLDQRRLEHIMYPCVAAAYQTAGLRVPSKDT